MFETWFHMSFENFHAIFIVRVYNIVKYSIVY